MTGETVRLCPSLMWRAQEVTAWTIRSSFWHMHIDLRYVLSVKRQVHILMYARTMSRPTLLSRTPRSAVATSNAVTQRDNELLAMVSWMRTIYLLTILHVRQTDRETPSLTNENTLSDYDWILTEDQTYQSSTATRRSDFYRASICEGGLGSRNSVCLSVCHTRGLWQN